MANKTVVVEDSLAEVVLVEKRGKEGPYKAKVVKVNNKDWVVSKNDKDKVKVGQKYHFELSKSEYDDKLYYWANLIDGGEGDDSKNSNSSVNDQDFKKKVFSWLNNLSPEEKKKTIIYLLEKL